MIFDKRIAYKPFEYPEVLQFIEAINKSFWVHSEIDFTADIQDFNSYLNENEKNAIKNSLLAIAQIEVSVKSFWGNLYNFLPKPEFNGLGSTFAECEFRHSEAYSRLLEVLGYNNEFNKIIKVPVIKKRIEYLQESLSNLKSEDKEKYVFSLILFSLLIENVSLFSQFAIMLSFTRFKGLMKNISNIIAWTSIDEQIHANAGLFLINKIKEEYPEMFNDKMIKDIIKMVHKAIKAEINIVEWIFEKGEIETINKQDIVNFMKYRIDESLSKINIPPQFKEDIKNKDKISWFEEEVFASSLDDFFAKRPVDYTKHDKSITVNDLF